MTPEELIDLLPQTLSRDRWGMVLDKKARPAHHKRPAGQGRCRVLGFSQGLVRRSGQLPGLEGDGGARGPGNWLQGPGPLRARDAIRIRAWMPSFATRCR